MTRWILYLTLVVAVTQGSAPAPTVAATTPRASLSLKRADATVLVNYDGGTGGGTITNGAHLTGSGQTTTVGGDRFPNVTPISLTACNTQTIGPHVCTPGAPGCRWKDGDMLSYDQRRAGGVSHRRHREPRERHLARFPGRCREPVRAAVPILGSVPVSYGSRYRSTALALPTTLTTWPAPEQSITPCTSRRVAAAPDRRPKDRSCRAFQVVDTAIRDVPD